MKRILIVLIFAFLIAGGTVGILYQEGFASGVQKSESQEPEIATEEDAAAALAEQQDIAASYGQTEAEEPEIGDSEADIVIDESADLTTEAEDASLDESTEATETTDLEEPADTEATDTEAAEAESTDAEAEEDKAKEEEESKEDTAKNTSDADKEAKGPFYSVKVLGYKGGALLMHKNSSGQGDTLGNAQIGDTGYMIGSKSTGTRRLCYINGKICYLSKNCTEVTEIKAEDYPDALLEVTANDAGSDFSLD